MLDMRQMQALTALARTGSVARAAHCLGWSQATVDYHLKNLDRLAGAALTQRSTRGTKLTTAGLLMCERAEEILTLANRSLQDVKELATLGRVRLRFGIFPTAAAHLLPAISSRLSKLGIELDTTLEEVMPLVQGVNLHKLDAALSYAAGGYTLPFRQGVHTTHIFSDPLLVALPETHPLAAQHSLDFATLVSLSRESWVVGSTPGDTIDELVNEIFLQAGIAPAYTIRSDDYSVVLGLIAANMGVAIVPSLVRDLAPRTVSLIPIADPRFTREVVLATPANSSGRSAAVRQLAEAVRRSVAAVG